MANPIVSGLGALGQGLLSGAKMAGQGIANLGKRLFGIGGGAAGARLASLTGGGGDNQQGASGSEEQQLNIDEADATPNVTPIQQLNMAASGLISPMAIGGTPDEKLDYIASSIDSMRRSLSTLVSSVRSLAIGQATVNRNVAATAERPKSGFFSNTIRGAAKAAGIGTLAALGLGAAVGGLSALTNNDETSSSTLDNITPAINEIKSGQIKPEESNLYKTADTLVTRYNQSYGMPVSFETSIEKAMEENEEIKTLVESLKSNGVEVDTKAMLSTLPDIIKQIKPEVQQEGSTQPSITPTPNAPAVSEGDGQPIPSPDITTPPVSETDQTVLENSTAAPSGISPPAAPPSNNGADIENQLEGETQEDELGLTPQSSINDMLQEQQQEQILSSTRNIRDRSMETANAKSVIAPVVVNAPQTPSQQPVMQAMGDSRDRGATLTVAYRTPADSRTYSQDNFASV